MPRLIRRRGFWIALGAAALVAGVSGESVRSYWAQRREVRRLEKRLAETRRRVLAQEERLALSTSDEFLETAARRELGLLKPGEIEFRFVDADDGASPKEN